MLPITKPTESQQWELALHKALDLAVKAMVALSMTQGATLKAVAPEKTYSYHRKTDVGSGITRTETFTFRILQNGALELIDYDAKDIESS